MRNYYTALEPARKVTKTNLSSYTESSRAEFPENEIVTMQSNGNEMNVRSEEIDISSNSVPEGQEECVCTIVPFEDDNDGSNQGESPMSLEELRVAAMWQFEEGTVRVPEPPIKKKQLSGAAKVTKILAALGGDFVAVGVSKGVLLLERRRHGSTVDVIDSTTIRYNTMVHEGGKPRLTKDDVKERLAKVGFRHFSSDVDKLWKKEGSPESNYRAICRHYKIPFEIRTENIPCKNYLWGRVKSKKLSKDCLRKYLLEGVSTGDRELDSKLDVVNLIPFLRGEVLLLGIKREGNSVSSRDLNRQLSAQLSYVESKDSFMSVLTYAIEKSFGIMSTTLNAILPGLTLPTILLSEMFLIEQLIQDANLENWLKVLTGTQLITWLVRTLHVSVHALYRYFVLEEPLELENFHCEGSAWLDPFKLLARARSSPMWVKVSAMVSHIIGSTFLKGSQVGDFVDTILIQVSDVIGNSVDGILAVHDALSYIFKRLMISLSTGNIEDFFEPDPITVSINEMKDLSRKLMSKTQVVDPRSLLVEADGLLTKYSRSTHGNVMASWRELKGASDLFRSNLKTVRQPPLGYIFHGRPGLGKSLITGRIEHAMKAYLHLPKDIGITLTYSDTKHQQLPSMCQIVLLNDWLAVKDELSAVPTMALLQQLVDSAVFRPETASIEDKANSNIEHRLVLVSTNTTHYEFTTIVSGAEKLNRRYKVVRLSLAPDFIAEFKDEDTAYRSFERAYVDGKVIYEVCHLEIPKNSNTISFKRHCSTICTFRSVELLVKYIMEQVVANDQAGIPQIPVGDCACTFSRENCMCGAFRIQSEVVEEGNIPVGMPPETRSSLEELIDKAKVSLSGVITTGIDKGAEGVRSSAIEFKRSLDEFVSSIGERVSSSGDLRWIRYGSAMALSLFCMTSVLQLIKMGKEIMRQGATVSSLVNVFRGEDTSVPYDGVPVPWLGKSVLRSITTVVDSSTNRVMIHGTWISNGLLAVPKHLNRDPSFGYNNLIRTGQMVFEYVNDDASKVYSEDKDLMFLFVPSASGIFDAAYTKLEFTPSAPVGSRLYFKGREVLDWKREGPQMISGVFPETQAGDCGQPIYDSSGKIHGIYVGYAAGSGRRYWVTLCRADVDKAIQEFAAQGFIINVNSSQPSEVVPLVQEGKEGAHPKSALTYYGQYVRPLESIAVVPLIHVPTKETMKVSVNPTPLRAEFTLSELPIYTAPFLKKVAEYVDGEGVKKYNAPVVKLLDAFQPAVLPPSLMSQAVEAYLSFFVTLPPKPLRPLGIYQAICGSEINSLINARDNSKATGYTLLRKYGISKSNAFIPVGDSFKVDERVIEGANCWYEHFFSQEPCRTSTFKASRKAEAITEEKSKKGNARIFSVGDLDFNIAFRMICLPVIAHLMSHPFESRIFACMNAGSDQWKDFYDWLKEYRRLSESDQRTMDGHHRGMNHPYITFMVKLAKKLGYTEEEARAVGRAIWCATCYVLIIDGEFLYLDWRLNSGRPDTLICNSVIGILLLLMFLIEHNRFDPAVNEFVVGPLRIKARDAVHNGNTGDDSLASFHDSLKVPVSLMIAFYRKYGYELTRADKKEGNLEFMKYEDVTYLKRKFVISHFKGRRVVLAPLAMESILKSLCYVVDGSWDDVSRQRNVVLCAMREFFLHGAEVFDSMERRIKPYIDASIIIPRYDTLVDLYLRGAFTTWEPTFDFRESLDDDPKILRDEQARSLDLIYESSHCLAKLQENSNTLEVFLVATELNSNVSTELHATGTVTHLTSSSQQVEDLKTRDEFSREAPKEVSVQEFCARPRAIFSMLAPSTTFTFVKCLNTFYAMPPVKNYLKGWALFRGDLEIEVMWTGSPLISGMVRLWAYPNLLPASSQGTGDCHPFLSSNPLNAFVMTSQLPHQDLDMSLAGRKSLKLGWPSKHDYAVLGDINDYDWNVALTIINPLWRTDGATVDPVIITVYASYTSVKVDRIVPQGNTDGLPDRWFSRGLKYASYVASRIPFKWASPYQKVLEIGSEIAYRFGYGRLPQGIDNFVVARMTDNPNLVDSPDMGLTLGMFDHALVSKRKSPLYEEGETSIKSIIRRKAQIVANWSPDEVVAMEPMIYVNYNSSGTAITEKSLTPLSHIAACFEFWTGSLEVCVEVLVSPLVRARLGVIVVPPGVGVPLGFPGTGEFLTTIIDVAGSTCVDIEIPYLYRERFRRTAWRNAKPAHIAQPYTTLVYYWLTGPFDNGATTLPAVNLYMRAGENFEFGVPTTSNTTYAVAVGTQYQAPVALREQETFEAINPQYVEEGSSALEFFGEEVTDVMQLAKRRCYYTEWTWRYSPTWPTRSNYVPNQGTFLWTYLGWLSLPFHAISGSVTYYVVTNEGEAFGVTEAPNLTTPYPYARGTVFGGPEVEVRVPDRNFGAFWHPLNSTDERSQLMVYNIAFPDLVHRRYVGGGEDICFSGYLCAPVLL